MEELEEMLGMALQIIVWILLSPIIIVYLIVFEIKYRTKKTKKIKPIIKKRGRYTKMRDIKVKKFIKNTKKWVFFKLADKKDINLYECIDLIDQNGQDLCIGDLVLIENNIMHKQFRIVFNQQELAFGFQTEDAEKEFFTLKEIRDIFKDFTITKVGNIFNQQGG